MNTNGRYRVIRSTQTLGSAWLARHANLAIVRAAEQAFVELQAIDPGNVEVQEGLAAFLLAERRYADAIDAARGLIELDQDRISAYEFLAEALLMSGDFEAAIQASRQVLARDIERYSAVVTVARSYYLMGRHKRATDIYRQAVRFLPNDHSVAAGLAAAFQQLGDTDSDMKARLNFVRARQLVEDQLRTAGPDGRDYASLAYYCAVLTDKECAREHRLRALAVEPDSADVSYLVAMAAAELGESEGAAEAAERAIELGYPRVLLLTEPKLAAVWSDSRFATTRQAAILDSGY